MKRYYCSTYVKKRDVSDEANKRIADDLALFAAIKFENFSILNHASDKNSKMIIAGTPHVYLKDKYKVSDYFVTAVEGNVRMVRNSQKELLEMHIDDINADIKSLAKKEKDLNARLGSLKKMKASLILYTKNGGKKRSDIKNFKSSAISFKPDGTVSVGIGKHMIVYKNIWLFEHVYLDKKIRQIQRAIDHVKKKHRRKEHKLLKFREQIETERYSIYFGSRELMHKDIPKPQKDKLIKKKRQGSMTLSGRSDANNGNFMVSYDTKSHELSYRGSAASGRQNKDFHRKNFLPVGKVEFGCGQALIDRLIDEHQTPVSWTITDCGNAWRFDVCVTIKDDRKNDFYGNGCIAMDINWDRIAVTELDGEGSLLNKKVIPFKMEGLSSEQTGHQISNALEAVFAICCEKKKPLVAEDIGRTKRKQDLYSKTAKKNRRISMFASKKIRILTESKSFKYSVDVTFVNPAYTSQTGKVKYMRRFGMSIHEAAAYVIGRRGLGIIDRLPLIYRQQLKREHASLPRLTQWARAYRFTKAVQAAAMYQVDELPF